MADTTERARAVELLRTACQKYYGMSEREADALIAKANEKSLYERTQEELDRDFEDTLQIGIEFLNKYKEENEGKLPPEHELWDEAKNNFDYGQFFWHKGDYIPDNYWEEADEWSKRRFLEELRERGALPKEEKKER